MPRSDKKTTPQLRGSMSLMTLSEDAMMKMMNTTEAEMDENRRLAGLPDNWMNKPIKFGNGNHGENFVKAFTAHINQASK